MLSHIFKLKLTQDILGLYLFFQILYFIAHLIVETNGCFVFVVNFVFEGEVVFLKVTYLINDHLKHGLVGLEIELLRFNYICVFL